LRRLVPPLGAHAAVGQAAKLRVDERSEPAERGPVARAPGPQQAGNLLGVDRGRQVYGAAYYKSELLCDFLVSYAKTRQTILLFRNPLPHVFHMTL
jgi:hypothetical protein